MFDHTSQELEVDGAARHFAGRNLTTDVVIIDGLERTGNQCSTRKDASR